MFLQLKRFCLILRDPSAAGELLILSTAQSVAKSNRYVLTLKLSFVVPILSGRYRYT